MKYAVVAARSLFGLAFLVFGLNAFLHFMPMPPMPEPAKEVMGHLAGVGYLMPAAKAVEVVCGGLLLAGRFVPLGLVLIGPVVVNIVLFQLFAGRDFVIAGVVAALWLFLLWAYRPHFAPLFNHGAKPAGA